MNRFLELIKSNLHTIVFVFLCIVSILLIVNNNTYLKSVAFNSSNGASGTMYQMRHSVSRYFGLAKRNIDLQKENKELRELSILNYSKTGGKTVQIKDTSYQLNYTFMDAEVLKNSINKKSNYLTLNRGEKDGVKVGMGVISPTGLVGIVKSVSNRFCLVVSCLNTEEFGVPSSIEALQLNDGVLKWDGEDPSFISLIGISKFEKIKEGMEVVTGPFTRRFPRKTPIGVIEKITIPQNGAFYEIKVRLSTDFKKVNEVYIVKDLFKEEMDSLETEETVK